MKTIEEKIEIIPVDQIDDNPFQTRRHYPRKDLDELATSIDGHGLRQIPEARRVNGRVQIAYGHLRKRAITKLVKKKPKKWTGMPLRIKEITDEEMFYFALEENMRRRDVTPIDVALSVDSFLQAFPEKTEQEIAKKLNMSQGNISNMRRVLRLPAKILEKIEDGRISFTQGRELLMFMGKTGGTYQEFDRTENRYVDKVKDDEYLMKAVINQLAIEGSVGSGSFREPNTVDGIKKAIFNTCYSEFRCLYKGFSTWEKHKEPLFDFEKAGCLKCGEMVKAWETKSRQLPFCSMVTCWDKKQADHREEQAKKARERMEADMRQRAADLEKQNQQAVPDEELPDDISQEILTQEDLLPAEETTDTDPGQKPAKKVPKKLVAQAKEAAGTRAEILDLEDIREGHYGLKDGYVRLDFDLDKVIDPKKCVERCTEGFHYAFDSRFGVNEDSKVMMCVCSNPKCLGQQKAALTREKNRKGMELKKAEAQAISQAVDATTELDVPRIVLIIQAQLMGKHVIKHFYGGIEERFDTGKYWLKVVDPKGEQQEWTPNKLLEKLAELDQQTLARHLVDYMLETLRYTGNVHDYKIETTEALNRLGVGVTTESKKKKVGS